MPSDYLHLNFSFADSPPIVELRLVTTFSPIITLNSNSAFLRRDATWIPEFQRGSVSTRVYSAPFNPSGLYVINYAPELDAGFQEISVAVSGKSVVSGDNFRTVMITGPAGYSRSFTVQDIPEPTSALLILGGLPLVRRLRIQRQV